MINANVTVPNPEIDSTTAVFTYAGVAITSDLGSRYDGAIASLLSLDYSQLLGGNPIGQYRDGLSQIHFEPMIPSNRNMYGLNVTDPNRLNTSYGFILANGDIEGRSNERHGIDTIYINTRNGSIGRDQLVGTIVHEMLHESRLLDVKARAVYSEFFKAGAMSQVGWDSKEVQSAQLGILSAIEHLAIARVMHSFSVSNNLGYKGATERQIKFYAEALANALNNSTMSGASAATISNYIEESIRSDLAQGLLVTGTNDLGGVASYINEQGDRVTTNEGSRYTEAMLRSYGVETRHDRDSDGDGQLDVTARMTLGGHLRALADALGFDGQFGIQGTYARDGEGTAGNAPNDAAKPVILDLDGDGVEINSSAQISFDWDGDGFRESGNRAAADDGFLVVDLEAANLPIAPGRRAA